jgi:hypothetical protein
VKVSFSRILTTIGWALVMDEGELARDDLIIRLGNRSPPHRRQKSAVVRHIKHLSGGEGADKDLDGWWVWQLVGTLEATVI